MQTHYQNYLITDDKTHITAKSVKALLKDTYWAEERSLELIAKTIEHSICIGIFESSELIGFGRVVTDKAVFAWIADVIIRKDHRGKGLGKQMVHFIQNHPDIPASLQLLRTKDAHALYEQFGFSVNCEFMSK